MLLISIGINKCQYRKTSVMDFGFQNNIQDQFILFGGFSRSRSNKIALWPIYIIKF